jgi:hypothetical protein
MKARLIKETDAFGNITYFTELDETYVEGSLVYISLELTLEEKKKKVNEAFDRYSQIQQSKGIKTKEIVFETDLSNQ